MEAIHKVFHWLSLLNLPFKDDILSYLRNSSGFTMTLGLLPSSAVMYTTVVHLSFQPDFSNRVSGNQDWWQVKNVLFVCIHIKVSLCNTLYLFFIVLDAHMSLTHIYFMSFSTLMSHVSHFCHISVTCFCMSLFPVCSLAGLVCTMLPRLATQSCAASCYISLQILGPLTR